MISRIYRLKWPKKVGHDACLGWSCKKKQTTSACEEVISVDNDRVFITETGGNTNIMDDIDISGAEDSDDESDDDKAIDDGYGNEDPNNQEEDVNADFMK
jgi:hypothetical protein